MEEMKLHHFDFRVAMLVVLVEPMVVEEQEETHQSIQIKGMQEQEQMVFK